MRIAYNVALWMVLVLGSPVWIILLAARRKWRSGLWERLGAVPERLRPSGERRVVWVHAVSVGEVLAAAGLVRELEREFEVYVSTTTHTGQQLARQRFGEARVFYCPLDLSPAIHAYLRRLSPAALVLLETEFWPNLIHAAHQSGRVAVVNARISDRSLPGYKRWRCLVHGVVGEVDAFFAQSEEDAKRLVEIGAQPARVQVSGNLKFDLVPPPQSAFVNSFAREGRSPVIVAGSTVEGEEAMILRAFAELRRRFPNAWMVLAPRHPERFDGVEEQLRAAGARCARRSRLSEVPHDCDVLLLDSIGELAAIYAIADIAFVGGSLVCRGGHNVLEPAYFGKAIVVGPYTENFREIIHAFQEAEALRVTHTAGLVEAFTELASDAALRARLGENARQVIQVNAGATARTALAVRAIIGGNA